MISKENFIFLVNAVLKQIERETDFTVSLMNYFDGFLVPEISVELQSTILKVLANETRDNFEIIEWWLFDAPDAGKSKENAWIDVDSKIYRLDTIEQLYDFLVNDMIK